MHLRCTQCSILLHLMDICFLQCIFYDRYRISILVCVWLSDLDLSRHHPILLGAVPAIQFAQSSSASSGFAVALLNGASVKRV